MHDVSGLLVSDDLSRDVDDEDDCCEDLRGRRNSLNFSES